MQRLIKACGIGALLISAVLTGCGSREEVKVISEYFSPDMTTVCSVVDDAKMLSSYQGIVYLHLKNQPALDGKVIAEFDRPRQGTVPYLSCQWKSANVLLLILDGASEFHGPPEASFYVEYRSRWIKIMLYKVNGTPWSDDEVSNITRP